MKRISLIFAVLLALFCIQTASAQEFSTEQYNFRASFPGAIQQPVESGNLIQFQSYSPDNQLIAIVQYLPVAQINQPAAGTPDAAWWRAFEQGVVNGGKNVNIALPSCTVGTFEGAGRAFPAYLCSLSARNANAALAGRITFVYRDGTVYSVMAAYSVPGNYGDANVAAFMQSFAFLN